MAKISFTLLACLGLFGAAISHSIFEEFLDENGYWDYDEPEKWGGMCSVDLDELQSPIDLPHFEDLSASADDDFELDFINFDDVTDDKCELENDGRLASAICKSSTMRVSGLGDDPKEVFILAEFDIHEREAEHSIANMKYPMEVQMVSYNAKYNNYEEAKDEDDGLAVMSVFVKASGLPESKSAQSLSASESELDSMSSESNSATSLSDSVSNSLSESSSDEDSIASSLRASEIAEVEDDDNDDWEPLANALLKMKGKGKNKDKMEDVPMDVLKQLLPSNTKHFYRYRGTLTKPPCNKAMWTIFRKPVRISRRQLDEFRSLKTSHHHKKNSRPVQAGKGRKISRN